MIAFIILEICCYILFIFYQTIKAIKISYNQPKLPDCPQWDPHGITFAEKAIVGSEPLDVFINSNNTIYVIDVSGKEVHTWNTNSSIPTTISLDDYKEPWGLFVTIDGTIYVGSDANGNVKKWAPNETKSTIVMNASGDCAALFVDITNHLYCSLADKHQVVKQSLDNDTKLLITVAGTDTKGSANNMLNKPRGIFVDTNFDLYVADCYNNRIQLFKFKELNGRTVAGSSSTSNINLRYPTAVFLDADGHLFIVDNGNHRIVRSRSTALYCIAGCSGVHDSTSNHLNFPYAAAFDSYGNIFVADQNNDRIQKFMLLIDTNNKPSVIESNYLSALSENTETFIPTGCGASNYHYQVIQLNLIEAGCYDLHGNSTIPIHGSIYKDDFNPINPTINSFLQNDRNYRDNQFEFQTHLLINTTYLLVVTTFDANVTGMFSVLVTGPNHVDFIPIDTQPIIQSIYSSILTTNNQMYGREGCESSSDVYYEAIQINVNTSDFYSFSSNSNFDTYGYFYKDYFDPFDTHKNFILQNDDGCTDSQFVFVRYLQVNVTYVLVVTTYRSDTIGTFSIIASGADKVTFNRIMFQSMYVSELTMKTETYSRICGRPNYHYEIIQINVQENGVYSFDSNSTIVTYGYIYKNDFDPFNPTENVLSQSGYDCDGYHFHFVSYLQANMTYVLVVTTFDPDVRGPYSVLVFGPANVSLNRIIKKHSSCVIGDACNSYTKGIGLTLDDILRNEIQPNTTLHHQSLLIKMSAALTIIMFVAGFISSILSLSTFLNEDLRKVGCGLYLTASSITSLFTISLFTVKFWFLLFIVINTSVGHTTIWGGCVFIEPLLKFFAYLHMWLNTCVAIERAVNVSIGINFNRKKSAHVARWIIAILPVFVIGTIIHEPIYRDLFEYTSEKHKLKECASWSNESAEYIQVTTESMEYKPERYRKSKNDSMVYEIEKHVLCVINYSRFLQNYNTVILFFHLIVPFVANLFSALYIIFGTARQRSVIRNRQTTREHFLKQFNEHKQLVISPIILLVLSLPRLIISLMSGCVNASRNPWLYLCGYFISFTPSMLIFVVFVLPSELYMKTFKELLRNWRRHISKLS